MMDKEEYRKKQIKKYYDNKRKEKFINDKISDYYQKKNKEECASKIIKQYYQSKTRIEGTKKYYRKKTSIKKQIDNYRKLAKDDIIFQILGSLATRINYELKKRYIVRTLTYMEFLGCSAEDFKIYLEDKFTDDMSYDNYGDWVVDHIFPISKINFNDHKEIKKCFHYTNLQPLWDPDNKAKSNKTTKNHI